MGAVVGTFLQVLLFVAVIGACAIVAALLALILSIWFFVPLWQAVLGMAIAGALGGLLVWKMP